MCGILLEFFYLQISFISFLFELFFEQEKRFVHFAHILFLACYSCLLLFCNGIVEFFVMVCLLSTFYLVSLCPYSNWVFLFFDYSLRSLLSYATSLFFC